MIRLFASLFAAAAGLAFGSFLNVCLSRWPAGESIVQPRSRCQNCNRTLTWWENIPLVSWLALGGRCRTCKVAIGWRYPLVEAAVGLLWAFQTSLVFQTLEEGGLWDGSEVSTAAIYLVSRCILFWLLVALAVFDAENLWLPDRLTIPGMVLGFFAHVFTIVSIATSGATDAFINLRLGAVEAAVRHLLGIVAAAGVILLFRWLYKLLRHREGLGLGDAKLMALLAAWLGLPGAALAFVVGVVLGTLVALLALLLPRRQSRDDEDSWAQMKLPLGTFLCIGGIVSALWGRPLIALYRQWAGF